MSTTSTRPATGATRQPPEPLPEVRIEVVLTGLSEEAQRRFAGHLRPWSGETDYFAPPAADNAAELADGEWCLPVVFVRRSTPRRTTSRETRSSAPRSGPTGTTSQASSAAD